jgi:hypothetical protein
MFLRRIVLVDESTYVFGRWCGAPVSGAGLISGFSGGKKKSQNKNFDDHITTI